MVIANPISINRNQSPIGKYSNSTSYATDDVVTVQVENFGKSPVLTSFSVYLDENTDLASFNAVKNKHVSSKMQANFLKPTSFTDDLFNEENKAAWAKLSISTDEDATFSFCYNVIGGNPEKHINKFLSELVLDTKDPQQLKVVISSANFGVTSYPSNSKHLWNVRCNKGYTFNIEVKSFDIESEFDSLILFDVSSEGPRRLISEISAVGTTETNTDNLLLWFRSDCDLTFSGFRAVVTAVKRNSFQETTTPAASTNLPERTQTISANELNETTPNVPITNVPESTQTISELEVVEQALYWQEARSYCQQKGGDLIQFNPKLYTYEGRTELAASLNLPYSYFHTGIKRDPSNYKIFRRVSDGVQVELDGWIAGRPSSADGYDNLYWFFYNDSNKNTIYNYPDHSRYFICEFY